MEKRLKKERNKLYRRITLIMTAVWLTVSTVFCVVFLNVQKYKLQSEELTNLSVFTEYMNIVYSDFSEIDKFFFDRFNLIYDEKKGNENFNSHMIITDLSTNEVIVDTQKTVGVRYIIKGATDNNLAAFGLINYDSIRGLLTDGEFKAIKKLLTAAPKNGNYYELICTRCQFRGIYIVPLTMKIVLVDGKDKRFKLDDEVCTFDLEKNRIKKAAVFKSGDTSRNVIPADFLLNKAYQKDLISFVDKKQQKESSITVSAGFPESIIYVSNNQDYDYGSYYNMKKTWMFQYAKKINFFDFYKDELMINFAVIFAFFLIIAVILCLMIWKTVKTQIIEEHKRVEFTNAFAHDIKTPLFVISGYAYSLQEDIDADERDKYLDKILEQTEDINSLVHRMLNFSKLDSYSTRLNISEFDLYEMVEAVANGFVKLPDDKKINLSRSGDNLVKADRGLIKQAVENLVENAVLYSAPESVIEVNVDGKTLTVSNPCDNLTKEDLKKLTQPYFRKDKSRNSKGNGLGLSIVKSIADLHKFKFIIRLKNDVISFAICF